MRTWGAFDRWLGSLLLIVCVLVTSDAAAQESLADAKRLYGSAEFNQALDALDRLRPSGSSRTETIEIDQYRVFCLFALNRVTEAEGVIEKILWSDPSYRPTPAEVSPRINDAFRDVRRRMLPQITRELYRAAKETFDRREYAQAATEFTHLIALMEEDTTNRTESEVYPDLRVLAAGFLELSLARGAERD